MNQAVGKCQIANGIVVLMAIEIVSIITEGFTQSVTIIEHRCYTIEPEAVSAVSDEALKEAVEAQDYKVISVQ